MIPTQRQYRDWLRRLVADRGRCESCGHTAAEVGQSVLHVHHLMKVAALGLADPSVMDVGNCVVLCNCCHSLFHPGYREYNWDAAGKVRGIAFSG